MVADIMDVWDRLLSLSVLTRLRLEMCWDLLFAMWNVTPFPPSGTKAQKRPSHVFPSKTQRKVTLTSHIKVMSMSVQYLNSSFFLDLGLFTLSIQPSAADLLYYLSSGGRTTPIFYLYDSNNSTVQKYSVTIVLVPKYTQSTKSKSTHYAEWYYIIA